MNISLSSVLKGASFATAAIVIAGCGPNDGSVEFNLGKEAYEAQNPARAAKFFEKSLEAAPGRVDALVYLALAKLGLGELEDARSAIAEAEALSKDGDTDVKLLSAQIAYHLKDFPKALRLFDEVVNAEGASKAVKSQAMAGAGVVHMVMDNRDFARIAFLSAIRSDRSNAVAYYHLGLLYRDAYGYLNASLELLNKYIRLSTADVQHVRKIERDILPGLKDSISNDISERPGVSRRNTQVCAAAISAANAAEAKGAWKTAEAKYKEALAADPISSAAASGLARAIEHNDSSAKGKERALGCYRTICELSPGNIKAFLSAGSLAYMLARYGEAVEIYSRAVAAAPSSIDAIDGLIRSLQKTGDKRNQKIAAAYQKYRESVVPIKRK